MCGTEVKPLGHGSETSGKSAWSKGQLIKMEDRRVAVRSPGPSGASDSKMWTGHLPLQGPPLSFSSETRGAGWVVSKISFSADIPEFALRP